MLRLAPYSDPESEAAATGFERALRRQHMLLIPGRLNDRSSGLFLLDTGASVLLMNQKAAAQTGARIRLDPRASVYGVQGRIQDIGRADRLLLSFFDFRQEIHDGFVADLSRFSDELGIEIAAVLGMPVFRVFTVTIDPRAGAVRFRYNQ
jgi:hypothetical protein